MSERWDDQGHTRAELEAWRQSVVKRAVASGLRDGESLVKWFEAQRNALQRAIGHSNCYCDECKSLCRKHWKPAPSGVASKREGSAGSRDAIARSRADGFFIGWLDAIWSAFGGTESEKQIAAFVPHDVRRALIRRGWVSPRSRMDEEGEGVIRITPLGMRTVIERNIKIGIHRTIYDEDENQITPEEWLRRYT